MCRWGREMDQSYISMDALEGRSRELQLGMGGSGVQWLLSWRPTNPCML